MRIVNSLESMAEIPRRFVTNNAYFKDNLVKKQEDNYVLEKTDAEYDIEYKNEALEKIIDDLNEKLNVAGRELVRSIHDKTGQVMVKVVDTETGKTIREIPHEKSLDILAKVLENSGLLLDKKA